MNLSKLLTVVGACLALLGVVGFILVANSGWNANIVDTVLDISNMIGADHVMPADKQVQAALMQHRIGFLLSGALCFVIAYVLRKIRS